MTEATTADRAGRVRSGEELNGAAVEAWLRSQGFELHGTAKITQFSGGASNWTYRIEYDNCDLILRRPPAGTKAKSAHDMHREFVVQKAIAPVYSCVPKMLAYCDDQDVLGVPFYVMERIAGIIPRKEFPRAVALSPAQARQLCLNVIDKLVELHRVDWRAAGLEKLGKGEGYTRRQIEGWIDRWDKARTWNVFKAQDVKRWLLANIPGDVGTCLIHNDWRLDNLVLDAQDPTRVIGVLDWEMATLGDPLMELGSAMAYWTQADDDFFARFIRRQPSHLPGMLRRDEMVEHYRDRAGLPRFDWRFYEAYGQFRLAAIIQQIYYRYHHGQTSNPAYRFYGFYANYMIWRARSTIRRGRPR